MNQAQIAEKRSLSSQWIDERYPHGLGTCGLLARGATPASEHQGPQRSEERRPAEEHEPYIHHGSLPQALLRVQRRVDDDDHLRQVWLVDTPGGSGKAIGFGDGVLGAAWSPVPSSGLSAHPHARLAASGSKRAGQRSQAGERPKPHGDVDALAPVVPSNASVLPLAPARCLMALAFPMAHSPSLTLACSLCGGRRRSSCVSSLGRARDLRDARGRIVAELERRSP